MKCLLGKKINMSQLWKDEKVMPVTLIQAGPCKITQIKTKEIDGYDAVQIGYREKKKNIKKPEKNKEFYHLKEFKCDENEFKMGNIIDVSVFQEGDKVKISGISKGKGFQGVVKRWNFAGQSASHGTKHSHRGLGSIGSMFPQRVIKGRKMPGRMGSDRITVKNLEILKIDKENNIIYLRGAVPGRRGTLLEIKSLEQL